MKLLSGSNELDENDDVEPERDGGFEVKCAVEGGEPEPEIRLYAGSERVDAEQSTCRDED